MQAGWYSSCLPIGMAFLADPGVPRPPFPTRLILPFDWSDWLPVILAAFLATSILLQGALTSRDQSDLRGLAVCQQQTFPSLGFFLLAAH
jgi:hypothetical protein